MFNKIRLLMVFAVACGLAACTAMTPEPATPEGASVPVRLDVRLDAWDASPTKAGVTDSEWQDGSRIFFKLKGIDTQQVLFVEYQSSDNGWYLAKDVWNADGLYWHTTQQIDLSGFSSGECEAYYFENSNGNVFWGYQDVEPGRRVIDLSATAAVYHDAAARYGIADGELTLSIHLVPLTGRIRLASPDADYYSPQLFGLRWCSQLDLDSFELSYSTNIITSSYIGGNQSYSLYFYGSFVNPDNPVLTLCDANRPNYYYERSFTEDILAPGRSSWAYMPTRDSHNEWYLYESRLDSYRFNVSGLNVLYVVPGTFLMGGEDAGPIHPVTLSRGYYLGETEVTRNAWYSVMGEPSNWADSEVPVTDKSWDEVQSFIAALNAMSGYSFRLPTEAEWEFAARGALKTNGFRYSGSNNLSEVAVHGSDVKSAKTRDANEWGFYDMSGNAAEWCSDWMDMYPDGAVVDPKGPASGTVHVTRGGSSWQDDKYMTVSYRDRTAPQYRTGFRLALDAPKIQ